MCRNQVLSAALILLVLVATLVHGRFIPDSDSRSKRQSADVRTAEYLAWIALAGGLGPGCADVACGVVDVDRRLKRTSSDQRIAELQALIAMSRGGALVGHGQVDPYEIGKRKRDVRLNDNLSDIQRFRILRDIFKIPDDRS
ncbi:uncharacterized protein LOC135468749 [Liolophura sinensis]|uniref:uncharacterized protein LOC135468749 n=1 Tax=Liolophura sinensis TaxID=3198878 RepID=UPI003157F876